MPHHYGTWNHAVLGALLLVFGASAAQDRITRPVDPRQLSILKEQVNGNARPQFDRGPLASDFRIQYATLYLRTAPGLETFLASQQDPSSPDYHRWLTPEQFADRFGMSGNDIGKLVAWLQSQGLKVHDVARGRHWITFSGTAAQAAHAFHTELHRYAVNGESHFANATAPSIPAAFENAVSAVGGLDDFTPRPMHRRLQPKLTIGTFHFLAPDDLATIYNIAPLYNAGIDGTGQRLAVIGRTNVDLEDIRAYRTRFNLPPNDPQIVLFGPDPGISQGDQVEADLDLELAGAIARNATLIYVNSLSVSISAQYAIDQNLAPVMTMSYGACELETSRTLRPVAQQANAQGITWMISSGDSGAATCDATSPTPQAAKGAVVAYPASLPEVTAVGGTEFNEGSGLYWNKVNNANLASGMSYIPERVWNDSKLDNALVAGGGGASVLFQKPVWQTGPGVPADNARDLPDVSVAASPDHDGFEFVWNGKPYIIGGTSASSPIFAGIVALLNHSLATPSSKGAAGLGNINPALYRLAQSTSDVFHDITQGDNMVPCAQGSPDCVNGMLGYAAGPGYDLASGLGSVDVARLIAEWNTGTSSTTTLSISPSAIAPGDPVSLAATVRGTAGIPTGTVTFVANDVTLGDATLAPGTNSATASFTADGTLIAGGNGTVAALYSGDKVFSGSVGNALITLKLPASGSLVLPSVTPNPVYAFGGFWPYYLRLNEKAGVPTTLTAFTVNGVDNMRAFDNPAIPANGALEVSLAGSGIRPPLNRIFHFEGMDANGQTWARDLTVRFLASADPALIPAISLTSSPSTVQQDPRADASCQWSQKVTVQELSGFAVTLSSLTAGGNSLTSGIPEIFGTTRLAPYGMLTGTLCFGSISPPSQKSYVIGGVTETGASVAATLNASFEAPPDRPATFSVSTPIVTISAADAGTGGSATLDLKFGGDSVPWNAAVLSAGHAAWLKVSSTAGTGSTTLNLQASGAGLSNGVYNAVLSIQASNASPQSIQVPVVFVAGASADTSITGVGNAASGAQVFAPGSLVAVYGNNLAPSTETADIQPLPLTLNGTSATVNGVSAPLWFVAPGQMNIQIPYETSRGAAVLGVNNNGHVAAFTFEVSPTGPGIFAFNGFMVPLASAHAGETIFGYITGDGDVTPTLASGATPRGTAKSRQTCSVTVGGEPAHIVFNGILPGLIGVTQINFTIPPDISAGVQPVVVTVGGVSSTPVNLTIN
jgi:uncharacterized protein (TIGR03437 family)